MCVGARVRACVRRRKTRILRRVELIRKGYDIDKTSPSNSVDQYRIHHPAPRLLPGITNRRFYRCASNGLWQLRASVARDLCDLKDRTRYAVEGYLKVHMGDLG